MTELLPGIEVSARGLRWEVVDVMPMSGEQTLYRLRGLDGAVKGKELDLLSPLETITPLATEINPAKAAPLQYWRLYHQAFLLEQAFGTSALLAVQPGRLKAEPYQVVPLMRALRMPRPRLLLCDDVGLGKTIQAALIITELMARRRAHRVLVVSPAGPLLKQWKRELLERFGLRVEVIDRAKVDDLRRKSELGANPFDQVPLGLVSIDFLKQERILEHIERTSYDIIVIDEAHHCADLGAAAEDYDDSLRRDLAKVLARRCDVLLLLTATPHNGNDRSFASLLELLDTSLVDGRGAVRGERYRANVVRRLKRHIKDPVTGEEKFKQRTVLPVPVTADKTKHAAFIEFQKALLDLIAPELQSAFRSRRYSDVLAFIALLKRSSSTARACAETLKVVRDRFRAFHQEESENQQRRRERIRTLTEYARKVERFGTVSYEEEQAQQFLVAEDVAEQLYLGQKEARAVSRKLKRAGTLAEGLDEIVALAEKAAGCDPKLESLADEVDKIRKAEPKTNVLIYTEYTDSQEALVTVLEKRKLGTVLWLSGDDPEKDSKTNRFQSEDNLILVSTDASAEGLNLHQHCHHLIHLELPFNPNRLEQRNGRIDRYGQTFNPIVRYTYLRGTFEDRILLRLIAKYERQRSRLGFVPNTLGITYSRDASQERLLKGLMDEQAQLFADKPGTFDFHNPDDDSLNTPAVQDILSEIDRSFKGFEKVAKNQTWLGEHGVNAETALIGEAEQAGKAGEELSRVNLTEFVTNAVTIENGTVTQDGTVTVLGLPQAWITRDFDELPGYDAETRTIRITTDIEMTNDAKDNPVGYLGRSHPLVKKALERVRTIAFGGAAHAQFDQRVTVVTGDDGKRHLLFTYLGTVTAQRGRVFEQVVAVKISEDGTVAGLGSPGKWLALTAQQRALPTEEIWKMHFQKWGTLAVGKGQQEAENVFRPLADAFQKEHLAEYEKEKNRLTEWFTTRVQEMTKDVPAGVQGDLFNAKPVQRLPGWAKLTDPESRIAAFAEDKQNPRALVSEAETILRLYRGRMKDLVSLSTIRKTSVTPLGMMMVQPREK